MESPRANDLISSRSKLDLRESINCVTLDDEDVFKSLSAQTARDIVEILGEEPNTASEIAQQTNNSVQTVSYHLDKLKQAGIVQVVRTDYSTKARPMDL